MNLQSPLEVPSEGAVLFPKNWSWLVIHAWLASRGLEIEWWEESLGGVSAHVTPSRYRNPVPGVTVISS